MVIPRCGAAALDLVENSQSVGSPIVVGRITKGRRTTRVEDGEDDDDDADDDDDQASADDDDNEELSGGHS